VIVGIFHDIVAMGMSQAIAYHDGIYMPGGAHSNLNTFTLRYPFAFKDTNQPCIQVIV